MTRRTVGWLLVAAIAACGGDSSGPGDGNGGNPPPPDPVPASVVVVDASAAHSNQFVLEVTVHLRNDGDAGVYKAALWALPTSPNGADTFLGETEPVEVAADYDESLVYTIETENFAKYLIVSTRDAGSAAYRQTDRFDFP